MKKILLVLLLFLLPLCLVPPTSAVYGDESPQSITSFTETLPDDVLYYPDSFDSGVAELADYGEISDESSSPDYILTHILDGSAFNETTATDIEIWFEVDTTVAGFEGFSYAHYMNVDSGTDVDLAAYDFDQDLFVKIDEPIPSSYDWMNGTIYDPDYWNTTHIAFTMYELSGTADLYWDYGEITIHRMTLADSDHYGEGFNDVSDWAYVTGGAVVSTSITSDGDVATFSVTLSGSGYAEFNADFASDARMYYEWRVRNVNASTGYAGVRVGPTGDQDFSTFTSTSWATLKAKVTDDRTVVRIAIGGGSADTFSVQADYARVSPANETGFQHDGSTIEGVTNPAHSDMDYVISSDGDILTLTVDQVVGGVGSGALQTINYDTTSTVLDMDRDYYQFFKMRYRVTLATACTPYIRIYSEGEHTSVDLDLSGDWVILRLNLHDTTVHGSTGIWFAAYMNHAMDIFTVEIDYLKLYSIANYTVGIGASMPASGLAYVDSGSLTTTVTGGIAMSFNLDSAISISSAVYTGWNLTLSSEYTTYILYLWNGGWVSFTGETSGATPSGTITDVQFNLNTPVSISALKFIDTRDWQDIGEVEFVIPIGWSEEFQFGYDAFFIFLGLIMIPASTMYLVRGGRKEMSSAKLFYGLIIFAVGFGLLVGGIMP